MRSPSTSIATARTCSSRDIDDYDAYYDRLRDMRTLPTTSQPSIGEFLEVYEPLLDAGHDIVSVHLAGGISGTVESARQASEQLGERADRVHVMDSGSGCGGEGLIVARRRPGGAGGRRHHRGARPGPPGAGRAGDVVRRRHARVPAARRPDRRRAGLPRHGAEDQADPHARRGDRAGRARAHVQARLRAHGRLRPQAPRGGRGRLGRPARAGPRRGRAPRRRAARDIFGCEPAFVSEIGPVIGTHVGPGLLGVGGVPRTLLGLG